MAPFGAPAAALVKRSEECFTHPGELSELWTRWPRLVTWHPINSAPRTGRSACRLISRAFPSFRLTITGSAGTAPCFASGSSRETSPPISRLGLLMHFVITRVNNYFREVLKKLRANLLPTKDGRKEVSRSAGDEALRLERKMNISVIIFRIGDLQPSEKHDGHEGLGLQSRKSAPSQRGEVGSARSP